MTINEVREMETQALQAIALALKLPKERYDICKNRLKITCEGTSNFYMELWINDLYLEDCDDLDNLDICDCPNAIMEEIYYPSGKKYYSVVIDILSNDGVVLDIFEESFNNIIWDEKEPNNKPEHTYIRNTTGVNGDIITSIPNSIEEIKRDIKFMENNCNNK